MADIRCGEARAVLAALPAQSVHCVITSPPYFGLRSYNGGAQEIGTEQTPQAYVAALMDVFRSVWRVLRDDGTLWCVLGDSYASSGLHDAGAFARLGRNAHARGERWSAASHAGSKGRAPAPAGIPPKSLLGIPWRVAFALQDDGWLLRQELIWHKPNPMPESVKDRCTRGHETVFMLARGPRYYYDADAIREPMTGYGGTAGAAVAHKMPAETTNGRHGSTLKGARVGLGRNKRSVWSVATSPLSSKKYGVDTEHYAAFPPELVRPMVRAGCPPDGTVLDPFCGSGTTGFVAVQEGRRFIGCDINADYVGLAQARIATAQPALPLALMAEGLAI